MFSDGLENVHLLRLILMKRGKRLILMKRSVFLDGLDNGRRLPSAYISCVTVRTGANVLRAPQAARTKVPAELKDLTRSKSRTVSGSTRSIEQLIHCDCSGALLPIGAACIYEKTIHPFGFNPV